MQGAGSITSKQMEQVLKQSAVVFNNHEHTYRLGDKVLKGVTPIVKWMYPETYTDIPQSVLMKAAEYGSLIHAKCEMVDRVGFADPDCEAVLQYEKLKEQYRLKVFDNEYLVNLDDKVASSIDVVCYDEENDVWPLGDIKTTSKIHVANVTLQLSIYAYLFELCNPGKKAGTIMVIWLPKPQYGQPSVMPLHRVPSEVCKVLIDGFLAGDDYQQYRNKYYKELGTAPLQQEGTQLANVESNEQLPSNFEDIEKSLINFEVNIKMLQEKQKKMKAELLKMMQENGVKKWQTESIRIIRKAGATRTSVDSAKLKKNYPDVFEKCKKTSTTAESLTIEVLKNEK